MGDEGERQLTVGRAGVVAFTVGIPVVLVIVSLAARASWRSIDYSVIQLFDVMSERNLPSWYASAVLGTSGVLCLLAAHLRGGVAERGRAEALTWRWMALLFVVMSIDELVSIHERVGRWARPFIAPAVERWSDGSLGWLTATGWIIPGLVVLILVLGFFVLWFRHAPRSVGVAVVTGFLILVAGAVGMEIVSSLVYERPIPLLFAGHAEELLELIGASVILVGLASQFRVSSSSQALNIRLERAGAGR